MNSSIHCYFLAVFVTALGNESDRPYGQLVTAKNQHYNNAITVNIRCCIKSGTDDPSLTAYHPCRRFFDRSNAFVPADHLKTTGTLRRIHGFPALCPFINACRHQHDVYRYADRLADVIVNVAYAGDGFPWHFDTNNLTIILAIQSADKGGS